MFKNLKFLYQIEKKSPFNFFKVNLFTFLNSNFSLNVCNNINYLLIIKNRVLNKKITFISNFFDYLIFALILFVFFI